MTLVDSKGKGNLIQLNKTDLIQVSRSALELTQDRVFAGEGLALPSLHRNLQSLHSRFFFCFFFFCWLQTEMLKHLE